MCSRWDLLGPCVPELPTEQVDGEPRGPSPGAGKRLYAHGRIHGRSRSVQGIVWNSERTPKYRGIGVNCGKEKEESCASIGDHRRFGRALVTRPRHADVAIPSSCPRNVPYTHVAARHGVVAALAHGKANGNSFRCNRISRHNIHLSRYFESHPFRQHTSAIVHPHPSRTDRIIASPVTLQGPGPCQ
jgi:hypothetical protein